VSHNPVLQNEWGTKALKYIYKSILYTKVAVLEVGSLLMRISAPDCTSLRFTLSNAFSLVEHEFFALYSGPARARSTTVGDSADTAVRFLRSKEALTI
jgi:hypothetical protein